MSSPFVSRGITVGASGTNPADAPAVSVPDLSATPTASAALFTAVTPTTGTHDFWELLYKTDQTAPAPDNNVYRFGMFPKGFVPAYGVAAGAYAAYFSVESGYDANSDNSTRWIEFHIEGQGRNSATPRFLSITANVGPSGTGAIDNIVWNQTYDSLNVYDATGAVKFQGAGVDYTFGNSATVASNFLTVNRSGSATVVQFLTGTASSFLFNRATEVSGAFMASSVVSNGTINSGGNIICNAGSIISANGCYLGISGENYMPGPTRFRTADNTTDVFIVRADGTLRTNQTAAGTALGSVTNKMPVYNIAGTLIGYVPLYDAIT